MNRAFFRGGHLQILTSGDQAHPLDLDEALALIREEHSPAKPPVQRLIQRRLKDFPGKAIEMYAV